MNEGGNYIKLGDLLVYRLALELGDEGWKIFENFSYEDKKIFGDQFIRAIDSVGANIAEGYGRYHYLDKIKFYYIARASLFESKHWLFLLQKRNKIKKDNFDEIMKKMNFSHYQLNIYIKSCYSTKKDG
jgi:four helix bundle protein